MLKLVTKTKSGRLNAYECKMASFSGGELVVVYNRTKHVHHWTEFDHLALSMNGTTVTLIENGQMVEAPDSTDPER